MAKGRRSAPGRVDLMAKLRQVQEDLERAQAHLAEETVEASAGGGAVKVVMSGNQECKAVEISQQLFLEADVELLQELVQVAVNQAVRDSQALAARRLGPLAGGLGGLGEG